MDYRAKGKINWGVLLTSVFFIVLFIYILISSIIKENKWENSDLEKRYSIADIIRYKGAGKSPDSFEYTFNFKGKSYNGHYLIVSEISSLSIEQRKKYIGNLFYVRFIAGDPSYNELLINKSVQVDSTLQIPKEGWEEIPR